MAKSNAVWGIDIGQCALKAVRCVPHADADKITAEAFDFIEYPKILSQPEADPVELVRDAIEQFLSRNKVKEDRVAISVPGQSGLARFIKLPPVDTKKIPDIVRYEARQQIPFALEDVVFDWQQMAGGTEEDGFSLETEVGLFAMKRDQVFRALRPFMDAGVEIDLIQLTPLALYNFVVFDQMQDLPPVEAFDAKDPPPSTIVVSLGTDTTDLVITNGYRVWQRNIPLGGNHFTKALTKELKLTFAKAEHLKRNALKAEDPKAVFLAMRPVFNDLVTEVQRSISFFQSVDRTAKIGRVIPLGNAMKLRGLQKYLGQSLGYEVVELKEYHGLAGPGVVNTPAFKDNLLSFGVCYGLALQGLGRASLSTNLIPPEIINDRRMRAKKPWMVAAVGALLLGCTAGYFGAWRTFDSVQDNANKDMTKVIGEVDQTVQTFAKYKTSYDEAKTQLDTVRGTSDRLNSINERRTLWPELFVAIGQCFPRDPPNFAIAPDNPKNLPPEKWAAEITALIESSQKIYVDKFDYTYCSKLDDWFAEERANWTEGQAPAAGAPAAPAQAVAVPNANGAGAVPDPNAPAASESPGVGPSGEGWIILIQAHHYHNASAQPPISAEYVRRTLLRNLQNAVVSIPSADGKPIKVPIKDLGVGYPMLVANNRPAPDRTIVLAAPDDGKPGVPGVAVADPPVVEPMRYDFAIQFCWKETPLSERLKKAASEKSPVPSGSPNAVAPPQASPLVNRT